MKLGDKIYGAIGLIGASITSLFGGWTTSTTSLFIFMLIDYITGLIVAIIFKNSPKTETGTLSSKVGYRGLAKKVMIVFFLLIGYRMDLIINTHYIRDSICIAFIVNELVSILENASLMGLPIPPIMVNAIDLIKSKQNNKIQEIDVTNIK